MASPLDKPLLATIFRDVSAHKKRDVERSLRQWGEVIRETSAEGKAELPLLKLAAFGDERSAKGSLRHDANVVTVTGVEGDYDAGEMPMREAADLLEAAGVAAMLYETPSHTEARPRWRVVCPLSRDHAPEDRKTLADTLDSVLGDVLTPESRALSQSFYFGRDASRSDKPPKVLFVDGDYLDRASPRERRARDKAPVAPERDNSRSGRHYSESLKSARAGFSYEKHLECLDDELAEYAEERRGTGTKGERDWERAAEQVEAEAAALESKLKDFGDDEDSNSASPFMPIVRWDEVRRVPNRKRLCGPAYTRGNASATVAPGGMGKSSYLISETMAMISGKPLLGEKVSGPLRVCMWNAEDDLEEMHRRFAAAAIHFAEEIEGTGYEGRLVLKASDSPLIIARSERGAVVFNEKLIARIIAWLIKLQIDVFIVDPFIATHAVQGNDNDAIGRVVRQGWVRIAKAAGCAVMLAHHTRKGAPGQTDFRVDDTLGAGALINAVRYARVLNKMDAKEEAPRLGVAPANAWSYFRVDPGKANLAPLGAAVWCHLHSVALNNGSFEEDDGDNIGVAISWEPPDLSRTSSDERESIAAALGDRHWRASPQAKDWVGNAFADALGLDLDNAQARAEVRAKISAALTGGWLIAEEAPDEHRIKRPMMRLRPKVRRSIADMLGQ